MNRRSGCSQHCRVAGMAVVDSTGLAIQVQHLCARAPAKGMALGALESGVRSLTHNSFNVKVLQGVGFDAT